MSANLYLVAGYVNTHNTWFCNFPVAPAGIYAGREARITGVTDAGTVFPICINAVGGMTISHADGGVWISGIVVGS